MLRIYARTAGLLLVLLGLIGISTTLENVVQPTEGILYLGTGVIFSYIGFGRTDARSIRSVIGGMGVLYLLSGMFIVVLFAVYFLRSLVDVDLTYDYVRIVFGTLNIFFARFLPCEDDSPTTS